MESDSFPERVGMAHALGGWDIGPSLAFWRYGEIGGGLAADVIACRERLDGGRERHAPPGIPGCPFSSTCTLPVFRAAAADSQLVKQKGRIR